MEGTTVKHIISFSGGVGSAMAGELAVQAYGKDAVLLLFADTLMEHESLYVFNQEVADYLGVELKVIAEGRTPWQVFADVKYQGNTRVDPCSKVLKREFIKKWLTRNYDPGTCHVHVGIDCTEEHRLAGVISRNPGFKYRSMLIENDIFIDPLDKVAWCEDRGISLPTMYKLGFAHNNCGGMCVKAGLGQFKDLYDKLPEQYLYHEQQQQALMLKVPNVKPFLRKTVDGKLRYLTLREYRIEFLETGQGTEDKYDIGGCGCAL